MRAHAQECTISGLPWCLENVVGAADNNHFGGLGIIRAMYLAFASIVVVIGLPAALARSISSLAIRCAACFLFLA
jgi:hypothetical protein